MTVAGRDPTAGWLGVGLDVEEVGGLDRLDHAHVLRAGSRWLRPGEYAWCAAQPSFREALVVALSCKEAVFKSLPAAGPVHEIALEMRGSTAAGRARCRALAPLRIEVRWLTSRGRVVTLAVVAHGLEAGRVLGLLSTTVFRDLAPSAPANPGTDLPGRPVSCGDDRLTDHTGVIGGLHASY